MLHPKKLIILLVFTVTLVLAGKKRYDGHKVFRFTVNTEDQAHKLASIVKEKFLDVWTNQGMIRIGSNDIRVAPEHIPSLYRLNIPFTVVNNDIQGNIDIEERLNTLALKLGRQSNSMDDWFKSYHTYEEIKAFTKQLNVNYPTITKYIVIGRSLEGYDIFGLQITGKTSNTTAKPGIFYNSLIHAREWITGATLTYIMNQLVTQYDQDDEITRLVNEIEWTIVPVVNVDGYRYTWAPHGDRLWRKNRRPVAGGCVGIDLNRNWDFAFKADPASDACQETYAGTSGFSEPEESAVAQYLVDHQNIQGYIDFHSYSQYWMYSWAYTSELPPDNAKLKDISSQIVQAIYNVNGLEFKYGNIERIIYPASGSSCDFAYGTANIVYSFGVELRPDDQVQNETLGFILPPQQIIPSGMEILAGVIAMANYILSH